MSPVDCILSETTIVQPDLVFLESARSSLAGHRGIEGPPTLTVEIVSRSSARIDRGAARLAGADRGALPPFEGLTVALEPLWS